MFQFKSDNVNEIQIQDIKETFILKKAKNKWELIQPKSTGPVQGFIGNDILWTMSALEFESTLELDPGNALSGLNQPLVSVKLLNKESTILAHLLIGKHLPESPGFHYLKLGEGSNVYTVKKRILEEISSNIKKLKGIVQPE